MFLEEEVGGKRDEQLPWRLTLPPTPKLDFQYHCKQCWTNVLASDKLFPSSALFSSHLFFPCESTSAYTDASRAAWMPSSLCTAGMVSLHWGTFSTPGFPDFPACGQRAARCWVTEVPIPRSWITKTVKVCSPKARFHGTSSTKASNSCSAMKCDGFVLIFSQRLHSCEEWWWMVHSLQHGNHWLCWDLSADILAKESKAESAGCKRDGASGRLWGEHFPHALKDWLLLYQDSRWDTLLAVCFKVALEIPHWVVSVRRLIFQEKLWKGDRKGLTLKGFFLFNKQETLNKPGNPPLKFDTLASS